MSKMSINFDNEEQYNNFIQSIKDEVLKEIPKNNNGHCVKNATIWNYAKQKIEELELTPYEDNQLKSAISVILRRSEEHTSELQSRFDLVCRLLLEKKKKKQQNQ